MNLSKTQPRISSIENLTVLFLTEYVQFLLKNSSWSKNFMIALESRKIRHNFRTFYKLFQKMKIEVIKKTKLIQWSIIVVNLDSDWTVWYLFLTFYSFILGKTILISSKSGINITWTNKKDSRMFLPFIKFITRAGSMHHASKKEFSASYLLGEQGTSEGSKGFHIDSRLRTFVMEEWLAVSSS